MRNPLWSDVREDWEADGSLRDVYVFDTTLDDWQKVLELVRSRGWPFIYKDEEHPGSPLPSDVREIFDRIGGPSFFWQIEPLDGVNINCHFFTPDEIEFDFCPRYASPREGSASASSASRSSGALYIATPSPSAGRGHSSCGRSR